MFKWLLNLLVSFSLSNPRIKLLSENQPAYWRSAEWGWRLRITGKRACEDIGKSKMVANLKKEVQIYDIRFEYPCPGVRILLQYPKGEVIQLRKPPAVWSGRYPRGRSCSTMYRIATSCHCNPWYKVIYFARLEKHRRTHFSLRS